MASHGRAHARALFETFVRPFLISQARRTPLLPKASIAHTRVPLSPRIRHFSSTPIKLKGPTKRSVKPKTAPVALSNESIPARQVRVVDPTTNDLGPLITRRSALQDINPDKERLICVTKVPRYISPSDPQYDELASNYDYIIRHHLAQQKRFGTPSPPRDELSALEDSANEEDDIDEDDIQAARRAPALYVPLHRGAGYIRLPNGEDWIPVCKVENKAEAAAKIRAQEAARKEQKKLAPEGVKIIELNWAIAEGDLGHRLKKVEEFLAGRRRVEVVIAPKRRGKKASREEAEGVLKKVREAVARAEGAKETRPMQGQVGGVVSLMVEGRRGKEAVAGQG
ncbi:hypothetical protein KVT40_002419 [Elsinoe batatas]|uniref:Translation initiation factor 3 N-terminal domain-containing protein n=1 Tax=Elsinoe batatas TaxID=2601811 RepID=A0A8K0L8L5_9PEZI|nr:hypothetical protein KVT40_002419 [Elsinoe batatas]